MCGYGYGYYNCTLFRGFIQIASFFRTLSPSPPLYAGIEGGHCHGACRPQWFSIVESHGFTPNIPMSGPGLELRTLVSKADVLTTILPHLSTTLHSLLDDRAGAIYHPI